MNYSDTLNNFMSAVNFSDVKIIKLRIKDKRVTKITHLKRKTNETLQK
jgi:hypothetical protein